MRTVVSPQLVEIDLATARDETLLANLLELYTHDLSAVFTDIELGADGRFGYKQLPLYWSEPERRFPFLIRHGGRVAGFVFVRRGSPAADEPDIFDVAEFFVLRRFRRAGVGRRAISLVWERLPGRWSVRVLERNTAGLPFWRRVIAERARTGTEVERDDGPNTWRVFSFDSRKQS